MPDQTLPDDKKEEALLVAAVVRGDMGSFRRLIGRYERLVISIVFKMITQREDAEDICQDVFLKVYEKLPTFRFASKLSTWIATIAFNTCVNFIRKRKPVLLQDITAPPGDDEQMPGNIEIVFKDVTLQPDEKLILKERETLLIKSIDQLTIIQKTVIHLFHYQELSLHEISEITALPVTTVKSHLFRGRKQLKNIIQNT